jgi:methyl-accepting chemotaxis protein
VVEYDLEEKIIDVNDKYLNILGLTRDEVIGTHHSYKMRLTEQQKKNYKKFWDELRSGKIQKDTNIVEIGDKKFVLAETYTPIKDEEGNVIKIIKVAVDLSEFELEKT